MASALSRVTPVADTAPETAEENTSGRYFTPSPKPGSSVVTAWADDYLPFSPKAELKKAMRKAITTGCKALDPSPDDVLHATFYGDKPTRADIENLILYNLDYTFTQPGRNGIRFEHGLGVPAAPNGQLYRFGYRYEFAPRGAGFTDWVQGRTVATFDWADLDDFSEKTLPAHVWLALTRQRDSLPRSPLPANTPFAVKIDMRRPPGDSRGPTAERVKHIIDGVVCAFQAHTDTSTSGEVAGRLAKVVPAGPDEIEGLLLERRWAALGAVPQLVELRGTGVRWNPSDDWCLAGELLTAASVSASTRWAIRGQIVELSRPS